VTKEIVKKGNKNGVVDKPEKTEKNAKTAPEEKKHTETELLKQRILATMKALEKNGVKEFTSTQIRDKLKLEEKYGRGLVRRAMKQLAEEKQVVIEEKPKGTRKTYVYKLAK